MFKISTMCLLSIKIVDKIKRKIFIIKFLLRKEKIQKIIEILIINVIYIKLLLCINL
jgi:hypothetical protein